jgi:hypothetical protein
LNPVTIKDPIETYIALRRFSIAVVRPDKEPARRCEMMKRGIIRFSFPSGPAIFPQFIPITSSISGDRYRFL